MISAMLGAGNTKMSKISCLVAKSAYFSDMAEAICPSRVTDKLEPVHSLSPPCTTQPHFLPNDGTADTSRASQAPNSLFQTGHVILRGKGWRRDGGMALE